MFENERAHVQLDWRAVEVSVSFYADKNRRKSYNDNFVLLSGIGTKS